MKVASCGIIIENQGKWLLGHVTFSKRWDIPKGRIDLNDISPLDTAIRECFEETSIDLTNYKNQITHLGKFQYMPKKDLYLFYLNAENFNIDINKCICTSLVDNPGKTPFPEMDDFKWFSPEDAIKKTGKSLALLIKNQLIDIINNIKNDKLKCMKMK